MGITYDNVYAYQMDKTYVIMSFTTSYNEINYLIYILILIISIVLLFLR